MTQHLYRCIVVDDESLGRELIATHLSQLSQFELVASCASAVEAGHYLNHHRADLIFLDIEMPVLKGTDFYQGLSHKPPVIFTTAYRDYAVEGFELEAVDYLLKPIVFARFFKAIERFLATQKPLQTRSPLPQQESASRPPQKPAGHLPRVGEEYRFVRVDRKNVRLELDSIRYIQSMKDYIRIHTGDTVITVKEPISGFVRTLPDDFVRVHRSYVVNRRWMTAVTRHDVELDDSEIPISDTYRARALRQLGVPDGKM